jgi:hypothetical protein
MSHHTHHHHTRSRRHRHGHGPIPGRALVLFMIGLVVANAGLHFYLAIVGEIYPLFERAGRGTLLGAYAVFAILLLRVLFLVYAGSPAVRHIFAGGAAIVAFIMVLTIALDTIGGDALPLWVFVDALTLAIAAFAFWTCLFSSSAEVFFNHQHLRN